MLRALSGKRGEIARCMAFSLEHAEAAHEVFSEFLKRASYRCLSHMFPGRRYHCVVSAR